MGMTSAGILFYGITFTEEEEEKLVFPWDKDGEELEPEEWFAKKLGIIEPEEEYEYSSLTHEEYSKYWAEVRKVGETMKCELVHFGELDSETSFAIGVKKSVLVADGWDTKEVTTLEIKNEWKYQLKEFCEKAGIEYKDPKWWLVSYYG